MLKTAIQNPIYANGKPRGKPSVNSSFFGVNTFPVLAPLLLQRLHSPFIPDTVGKATLHFISNCRTICNQLYFKLTSMHLLAISLFELGQFLRIVLWVFLPIFVIVLLIITYIHHRRKRQAPRLALEAGELLVSVESIPADMEPPEGDGLYKGLLWMKEKFEEYRVQSDERMSALKGQLDQRAATIEALKRELAEAQEKIADLSGKLESNMGLLMKIHKELDTSLTTEPAMATMPEAANGGPGEFAKEG